jgi:hypothetical protein
MRRYFFTAALSAEQCHGYYSGAIRNVIVRADSGEKVQLAFRHFLPFLDVNGFRGRFRLTVDDKGAFISLEKIN